MGRCKASRQRAGCRIPTYKGRLADRVGGLVVFKNDNEYKGSLDKPSRTGFLKYTFSAGDVVELHTHWNVNKAVISSIHVTDGEDRSTELNSWGPQFFGDVNAAVLAAHNVSATRPPTTSPPGRSLTL